MVNDGGIRNVLQTAELVSNGLLSLNRISARQSTATASAGVKRKPSRSLSEISGNTDRSIRMNLAQHTSAELKQVVTPLIKDLEQLDAAALLSLNPSKNGRGATLDPRQGLTVPPIHDRVSPHYKEEGPNVVRYLHVKEVPHKYSVGIFVFPPHAEIPLHDHPDMVVLSRVLYGELQVQSYDVLPDNDYNIDHDDNSGHKISCHDKAMATSSSRPPSSLSLRTSLHKIKNFVSRALSYHDNEADMQDDSVLRVKPNLNPMGVQLSSPDDNDSPSIISAPSVTCLYPHEGNCHAFVAGPNGAAVLDVLFPPYDTDDDRDCKFYEWNEEHFPPVHQQMDEQASSHTLTPIDQPEDFHCLSGSYGRFGACEEHGDDATEDDHNMTALCNL